MPLSANQRGIVAILGCMTAYTVNDSLVKQVLAHYPVGEVIFVRGAMTVMLIGIAVAAFGHAGQFRRAIGFRLGSRSLCDGLSTVCFIAALAHMPMANVAAVLQIAPLLITALAALLYSEAVGWRRWSAVAVGFCGALLVIKPAPSSFDIWALVAAGSALFAALREIQTRRIDNSIPTLVIAFWGATAITLSGAALGATETWRWIAPRDLLQLFAAAVFVGIAIYLMAAGFRGVDLAVVAPFRYSYLLTSAVAGYLVFAEVPDGWTIAGAVLIVGSGLYALHREAVRRRNLTGTASTAS